MDINNFGHKFPFGVGTTLSIIGTRACYAACVVLLYSFFVGQELSKVTGFCFLLRYPIYCS